MYSYLDKDGERIVLEDIYSGKSSDGSSVQFVKIRYKGQVLTKQLRVNIYPWVDMDKLPYFLLEGKPIYLEDMEDVIGNK